MFTTYVANCSLNNWEKCQKNTIFGVKKKDKPAILEGDLIFIRLTGEQHGLKAIWYYNNSESIKEPIWTDDKYYWKLNCKKIIEYNKPIDEKFEGPSIKSKLIDGLTAGAVQGSLRRLQKKYAIAYLDYITKYYENEINYKFDYLGEIKSIKNFFIQTLQELKSSLPNIKEEHISLKDEKIIDELEESEFKDEVIPTKENIKCTPYGIVGERIDLPILNYAPLNEMGVVILFGYYMQELGFSHLEEIRTGFPDAIGIKPFGKGKNKRVKIEFEFRSSSFLKHGHTIKECDIIICWINDWKECPLEVIELSSVLFQKEV